MDFYEDPCYACVLQDRKNKSIKVLKALNDYETNTNYIVEMKFLQRAEFEKRKYKYLKGKLKS